MLKEKDNSVRTAWINMDRQYQYRNDMILNLVDMVGSEIPQEKDVLQTALAVHDRASKVQASMDNPTPEMLEAYLNVQDSVRYALGYLLFETAKIPALKEDYGLFVFQEQLKGLEKRIEDKRNYFNYSVRKYNDYICSKMVASWLGCKKRSCFDDDIETLTEE